MNTEGRSVKDKKGKKVQKSRRLVMRNEIKGNNDRDDKRNKTKIRKKGNRLRTWRRRGGEKGENNKIKKIKSSRISRKKRKARSLGKEKDNKRRE